MLAGCSYSLVPSILVNPIMSAQTIASWAHSGEVVRDTLDTCVIKVVQGGNTSNYSIDMVRGIIIGLYIYGTAGTAVQQYFYGYDKGVYFLRRMSSSMDDTTISSGGYEFYNIRVNGGPVSRIAGHTRARADAGYFSQRAGVVTLTITGKTGARVSFSNLLGRNLFAERFTPGTHTLALDQVCRGRCPAGSYLLQMEEADTRSYSTLIIR